MSQLTYQDLARGALGLPYKERADLVSMLLASLGTTELEPGSEVEPPTLSPEWEAEILRRAEDCAGGKEPTIPWEEAREKLQSAQTGTMSLSPELIALIHRRLEAVDRGEAREVDWREVINNARVKLSKEIPA